MKYILLFTFFIALISCERTNDEFIVELENKALNNDFGVDLKYKVLEFDLIDTVFNSEIIDTIDMQLAESDFIISEAGVDKEMFESLYLQENRLRDQDYIANIVSDESKQSAWLTEYRDIIKRTKSAINDMDKTPSYEKLYLFAWHHKRSNQYWGESAKEQKFVKMMDLAGAYKKLAKAKQILSSTPEAIIYFVAKIKYEQFNPLLHVEQTLSKNVFYDNNKKLTTYEPI